MKNLVRVTAAGALALCSTQALAQGAPPPGGVPIGPTPAPAPAPAPAPSTPPPYYGPPPTSPPQGAPPPQPAPAAPAPQPAPAQPAPYAGGITTAPPPGAAAGPTVVAQRPPEGRLFDDGSGQPPFYEPLAAERLQLPPPPPPPSMTLSLTAYTQGHLFTGPVSGTLGEIGAKVGFKPIAIELGYLPEAGDAVLGVQFLRYFGVPLSEPKPGMLLSFLAPAMAVEVVSDFDQDVFGVVEMSGVGLGLSSCSGLPFLMQLRAPTIAAWLPFQAAGGGIAEGHSQAFFSFGFSAEVGLLFY